ncbi:MAG: type II toxin-antitoxin system VapC family toxin [Candidatus Rokubacteria bacterium]|nr:type II toxin-antitoxin system VapC family toxin [Candidatus Rokubacteria bacterium]
MRILLDTQCWLWMLAAPERFTPARREQLAAPEQELVLSAASSWEIAIKHSLGKLRLPEDPFPYLERLMAASRTSALPIEHRHAFRVAWLPAHHRDPFDRMLIAQAQVEGLPILTADPQFAVYDVELLPP